MKLEQTLCLPVCPFSIGLFNVNIMIHPCDIVKSLGGYQLESLSVDSVVAVYTELHRMIDMKLRIDYV